MLRFPSCSNIYVISSILCSSGPLEQTKPPRSRWPPHRIPSPPLPLGTVSFHLAAWLTGRPRGASECSPPPVPSRRAGCGAAVAVSAGQSRRLAADPPPQPPPPPPGARTAAAGSRTEPARPPACPASQAANRPAAAPARQRRLTLGSQRHVGFTENMTPEMMEYCLNPSSYIIKPLKQRLMFRNRRIRDPSYRSQGQQP